MKTDKTIYSRESHNPASPFTLHAFIVKIIILALCVGTPLMFAHPRVVGAQGESNSAAPHVKSAAYQWLDIAL